MFEALGGEDGDMDMDAGPAVSGYLSVEELGDHCFELLIAVAEGKETASERNGMGGTLGIYRRLPAVLCR